jgi:DNA-binding phage protein
MERWQKVEKETVDFVGQIIEKSDNPIVQHVLRIIQRDSEMHHQTQELILDTLNGTISLTPEEIGTVWELIEKHIKMEEVAVEMAEASKKIVNERRMPVQAYLIQYLLEDEQKHDNLLEGLGKIKAKMYPYG